MRSFSSPFAAMLGTREHRRARCLWIALRDGTVIGMTDHDRDIIVDMADISDVPVTFRSATGLLPSDVTTAIGLDADNFEVEGPLADIITKTDVLGGRFARARVRLFEVDWNEAWPAVGAILQGKLADSSIKGSRYVFEIRSDTEAFQQTIGRLITPYCDAEFGDSRCTKAVPQFAAEITAVTNAFKFTLDLAGSYANDYFTYGKVEFTSGELAATDPVEVFAYIGSSGLVTLLVPLAKEPEIGDQLIIKTGCSFLKKSDTANLQTCHFYDNVVNFRGMDQVPGSDQYLKIVQPGEA